MRAVTVLSRGYRPETIKIEQSTTTQTTPTGLHTVYQGHNPRR
jgi:hypothetical protein